MKKIIIVSVTALYLPMLPAAESRRFVMKPFTITCNETERRIDPLEDTYLTAWTSAYVAIDADNYTHFAAQPVARLVNKVSHIAHTTHSHTIVRIMTLLEYITLQKGTAQRGQMIDLLLSNGAHTRSTYGIGQDHLYEDHLPPIYYAIIVGNIRAFETLVQKDKAVPMRPAMDIWDKNDSASTDPSVKMFLEKLMHINLYNLTHPKKIELPESLPAPEILDSMLLLNDRTKDSSASCIVE